jgi:hypothetical protein
MAASAIIQATLTGNADEVTVAEQFSRVWLRHGIADWTFVDEDGDRIPVSESAAYNLLPWVKGGRLVADKADDLYAQDVLAPFLAAAKEAVKEAERLRKLARHSQRGPTPSTSPSTAASSPNGRTSSTRTSRTKRPASSST